MMPYVNVQPYEFREFPKHVTVNGIVHTCNDADEEACAREKGGLVREEDERERMMTLAEMHGLKIDRRWKLDRISDAIRNAGYDPDHDPKR
jgi:hypothetical protein